MGSRFRFEQTYRRFAVGELRPEDASAAERVIRAYELVVDPRDPQERRLVAHFGLAAAAAGYRQVLGTVSLHGVGFRDAEGERPLDAVYFFLEGGDDAPPSARP